MKTIAVLIPTFTVEYSQDFLSGIDEFFKEKDVRVIVAQTRYPHDTITMYNYQYWSSFELLKSEQVDAVIFVSGIYCSLMSFKKFQSYVRKYSKKKIFSTAIDLGIRKTVSVVSTCNEVYDEIVKHLKTVHGCRKIAFISANRTKSAEALSRYDAFLDAMKKCNLDFNQDLLFDGNFTDFEAKAVLLEKYKSKEMIDFDAVIAANDSMAHGIISALDELGVKVPDDVKVIGFDDSLISRISQPRISTVNQNVYALGKHLGELAYKSVMNESIDDVAPVKLYPLYRQSCGCIECNNYDWVYKDSDGKIQNDENNQIKGLIEYTNNMSEKNNIITIMDMVKSSNTLRQFFFNLTHLVQQADFDAMAVCLYDEPVFVDPDSNFNVPETAELKMYCDNLRDEKEFFESLKFNPKKELIPAGYLEKSSGMYIIQPIFSGETNYGYLICKIKKTKISDYNVYLKIIINALSQSYEYTNQLLITERLKSENSELDNKSKTDELTGILNRRGFKELGQRAIDIAQEKDDSVVVFFADMDGLKGINDNFGHEMGDKAIKLQAQVLKKAFRSEDIVGRLSGDEFGVVAVGMKMDRVEAIHEKIDELNQKATKKHHLPFKLSTSLGAVTLETSSVLTRLLVEADKNLYSEKRIKHAAKNNAQE